MIVRHVFDVGAAPNDDTGEQLRAAFTTLNSMLSDVYGQLNQFTERPAGHSGLTFGYYGGGVQDSITGNIHILSDDAIALTDNANNILYVGTGGNIDKAVDSSPPMGTFEFLFITTDSGVVTKVNDLRAPYNIIMSGILRNAHEFVSGGPAGDIALSGGMPEDPPSRLSEVLQYTAGVLTADLTNEFSISGINTINNGGGTDTSGTQLMVRWQAGYHGPDEV